MRAIRLASVDMHTNSNKKDGNETKEDDCVDQDREREREKSYLKTRMTGNQLHTIVIDYKC